MRTMVTFSSGEVDQLDNDKTQDPDQDKLDGLSGVNDEPDFAAGEGMISESRYLTIDEARAMADPNYDWDNPECPRLGLSDGRSILEFVFGATDDERSTEPIGYDSNDHDDMAAGDMDQGAGVEQNSDSEVSIKGSLHLAHPPHPDYQQRALEKIDRAPTPTSEDHERYRRSVQNNGRAGGELRGNNRDRHARTDKLLHEFGDGKTAPCSYCGTSVDHHSMHQDKIYPQCGYRYSNVIPACHTCNQNRSNKGVHEYMHSRQASKTAWIVAASWTDVRDKAKRIRAEGGVRIISVTGPYVTAHVLGDEGEYETTLQRGASHSIDQWTCSCPWFAYSFGRSGRWKKYEGRMCSHALALQYQAQSEGMFGKEVHEQPQAPAWDEGKIRYYTPPPPKEWRASFDPLLVADDSTDGAMVHTAAGLPHDVKEAVALWSSIKVNNKAALPNPEHDGFRYAFHQVMGDLWGYRTDPSDPEFIKGEHEATTFLKAFIANQRPSTHHLYRAIGLDNDTYIALLQGANTGSMDLPPASWSADKKATEQFGQTYAQETAAYDKRIVFVALPGVSSWALGRTSKTGYEREHIVGGRFNVRDIRLPRPGETTAVITLQEVDGWPEDFATTGDLIDHIAFDSEIASPQDQHVATVERTMRSLVAACDLVCNSCGQKDMGAIGDDYFACRNCGHREEWDKEHGWGGVNAKTPQTIEDLPEEWLIRAMEVMAISDAGFGSSQDDPMLPQPDDSEMEWPRNDALTEGEHTEAARKLTGPDVVPITQYGIPVRPTVAWGEGESRLQQVPIHKLQAEQTHVHSRRVRKMSEGGLAPIDVTHTPEDEYVINDGHHRAAAAAMRGDYSIPAKVTPENVAYRSVQPEKQKEAQVSSPEDPTDSPADEDEDNSALPGAQAAFAEPDAWSVEEFGTEDPSETLTAELHDEPEGALPATDGAEDVPEGAPAWLDPRNSSKEVKDVDNMDIAAAARNYLMTSTAVKAFTYAEQQEIINEGEGVTASNLDRLQLEGTHYERLEEQIARAEAVGESIVWW